MPRVIKLRDEKVETLFNRRDFEYLLEKYMGYEAVQYFRDVIEEIKDSCNERCEDLITEDINDITVSLNDLAVNINDLRTKLERLKEVFDE